MPTNRLDPLQREILAAFFRKESRFFLTGGAALAGYLLGHRTTQDLDLFTTEDAVESGERVLQATASELGATLERVNAAPGFRRVIVRRGLESVVVDIVRDAAPQVLEDKPRVGDVRLDGTEDIFANEISALLSRAEIRDLVDIRALERTGQSLEKGLADAHRKDGAVTPGQLAWVLSEIRIGEDAAVPGDVSPLELSAYLSDLVGRLVRLAHRDAAPPE